MAETYREILEKYDDFLSKALSGKSMFTSVTSTDPDTGETITVYSNEARPVLTGWQSKVTLTKQAIFSFVDFLFNDYDIEGNKLENVNFNTINGYADGSKSFEYYDMESQEFSEMPEYFWTRGNLYDMLPRVEEGDYLGKYIASVSEIVGICETWQKKYDAHPDPTPSTDSDGNTSSTPKVEDFWSTKDYLSSFTDEIDSRLEQVQFVYNRFVEAKANAFAYTDLFYDATDAVGCVDNFIAALNKTVNGPGTRLSDSFAKFGAAGFGNYSPSMSSAYTLFLRATDVRDNSKWAAEDEYDMYLRKIAQSMALVSIDYFETAKRYFKEFKQFREDLNV